MCPVVEVECPEKEWWNGFISRKIKGNLYEQLFKVHPVFKQCSEWSEDRDHLIGYVLHHEYGSAVWKLSCNEWGEKNSLKGMDMRIWGLCRHFGFEMSLYLLDIDHFVCSLPNELTVRIADDGRETLQLDLNVDDFEENKWDVIMGGKVTEFETGDKVVSYEYTESCSMSVYMSKYFSSFFNSIQLRHDK